MHLEGTASSLGLLMGNSFKNQSHVLIILLKLVDLMLWTHWIGFCTFIWLNKQSNTKQQF